MTSAQIGLIGLGVMGQNLARNIERNGYPIAVYNRSFSRTEEFMARFGDGHKFFPAKTTKEFVEQIERPRKIILLVKAGPAVDSLIDQLTPDLDAGDILIDGGNSFYEDTRRRCRTMADRGFHFIGSGVSGGEEGALWGPSLMPGGSREAYEAIEPIWNKIAAQVDDGPCSTYIGADGSGHFVKMVHNGIEYGDMQLIAEAYDLLRNVLGMQADELAGAFERWNEGPLHSFLIEITAKIFRRKDEITGRPLVEMILDKAGQKGTGRWTVASALELGVPTPTLAAAVDARVLSSLKEERVEAARVLGSAGDAQYTGDREHFVAAVRDALHGSKICSYAQGMALIQSAGREFDWSLRLGEIARIWKGGCIIRARFLDGIKQAYERNPDLANLLLDEEFRQRVSDVMAPWREVVQVAHASGVPVLAMGASLSYIDSYRRATLPQNLTQAQRDFFGAHTYERVDKPGAGPFHTEWESLE